MKVFREIKLSRWFFLFQIIWYFSFCLSGMRSGKNSQPTAESNSVLDTVYILASPFVLSFLFYNFYRRVNQYIVFAITPFLGLAMEWLLFKPADVLNESSTTEASLFFAIIWMVILIPPFYFTIQSQKSKTWFYTVLTFILAFLGIQAALFIIE